MKLFVGIGFSEEFRTRAGLWLKKVRKTADQKEIGIKWSPLENLHVTLVFLGARAGSDLPEISERLARVASGHAPFHLKVRHVGGFPSIEQARVLWLGVRKSQALLDLQVRLEKELGAFPDEDFDYHPHVTFGRLRSPKGCRDLLSPFQHADFGRQEVREIVLFESVQVGSFPEYRRRASFPLTGAAAPRENEDSDII